MARKTKYLDEVVEMSLYELATGIKTTERKTITKNDEIIEEIEITKKHAPDLKAIQLWLATKKPDEWGDVKSFNDEKVQEILSEITKLCNNDEE